LAIYREAVKIGKVRLFLHSASSKGVLDHSSGLSKQSVMIHSLPSHELTQLSEEQAYFRRIVFRAVLVGTSFTVASPDVVPASSTTQALHVELSPLITPRGFWRRYQVDQRYSATRY
jgi:hypothetical protein